MADRVQHGDPDAMKKRQERASRRQRCSFSCGDEVWDDAKKAWTRQRRHYWVWTEWLEEAIEEKTDRDKTRLGTDVFEPAPERLPPGRRPDSDSPFGRKRRSFTCLPEVWDAAKSVWWSQLDDYPMWTDWLEQALIEKTDASREQPAEPTTATHHHQPT